MIQDPFGLAGQPPPLSISLVYPDRSKCVVLERIEDDPEPEYPVHGRTKCFACDRWCHLGVQTLQVVESGEAAPMCRQCAEPIVTGPAIKHLDDRDGRHRFEGI